VEEGAAAVLPPSTFGSATLIDEEGDARVGSATRSGRGAGARSAEAVSVRFGLEGLGEEGRALAVSAVAGAGEADWA
jgi:hypothetical protein